MIETFQYVAINFWPSWVWNRHSKIKTFPHAQTRTSSYHPLFHYEQTYVENPSHFGVVRWLQDVNVDRQMFPCRYLLLSNYPRIRRCTLVYQCIQRAAFLQEQILTSHKSDPQMENCQKHFNGFFDNAARPLRVSVASFISSNVTSLHFGINSDSSWLGFILCGSLIYRALTFFYEKQKKLYIVSVLP